MWLTQFIPAKAVLVPDLKVHLGPALDALGREMEICAREDVKKVCIRSNHDQREQSRLRREFKGMQEVVEFL